MNLQLISIHLSSLVGQPCCRQRVNSNNINMLSIGFGKKVYHNKLDRQDNYYGEWEIGTYNSAWRIIKDSRIILGSDFKNFKTLDDSLQNIKLGSFKTFNLDGLNISVILDNDIRIDFFSIVDSEETFHIFLPNSGYIEFRPISNWSYGKSSGSWKPHSMTPAILP